MSRIRTIAECVAEVDAKKYLQTLAKLDNCVILAAVCDQIQWAYDEQMDKAWRALGFTVTLIHQYWKGYVGILDDGHVVCEELSAVDGDASWTGEIAGLDCRVNSGSFWGSNTAEIVIDHKNYAVSGRGLTIAVYDKKFASVVDAVCIDTHSQGLPMNHLKLQRPKQIENSVWWIRIRKMKQAVRTGNVQNIKRIGEQFVSKGAQPAAQRAPRRDIDIKIQACREKLQLSSLFPEEYTSKIKVRLVFDYGAFFWNCVETMLKAFLSDPRFDVCVIFVKEYAFPKGKEFADKLNIRSMLWRDYNVKRDKPNIMILTFCGFADAASRQRYYDCGHYSDFSAALPYTINPDSYTLYFNDEESIPSLARRLHNMHIDYTFWDTMIYRQLKESGDDAYCVEMGNPKFDAIFNKLHHEHAVPESWEKLRGKKVFLWAYDHDIETNNFTFDQYAKPLFDYFRSHTDIGLIFRPHPGEAGGIYWTASDIEWMKAYMNDSPNMIWDDAPDYSVAFDFCDVIMTDVSCGVAISGFSTLKPLCVFLRMNQTPDYNKRMYNKVRDCLYQVQSEQEVIGFFEMIQRGEDPMREQREKAFNECICHFDGQNGQRMKDFIVEKYFEKAGGLMKEPGGG